MSPVSLFLAALAALASWLAPNHYVPWLSFHSEVMMALAIALAGCGELLTPRRVVGPDALPLVTVATLVIALVPLLQGLAGLIRFAGEAWLACLYLAGFAIAQWLGLRLAERLGVAELAERGALLLLVASLLSVGIQLCQWQQVIGLNIFAAEMPPWGRPFANFSQPNHLATLLFMGLVGVALLYERRRIGGFGAGLAAVVLEFGMSMTGSRTAWLVFALLAVAMLLWRRRLALRVSPFAVMAFSVVFMLCVLSWAPLNDVLLLSSGRTLANQSDVGPRPLFYATMLDAVARAPLFGYGWDQGLVAQFRVLDAHPSGGRLMGNSHNLVLDLMVWNGVPLGLAIAGFFAWWFWRQARATRELAQGFALAALGGMLVHAMLEYPLSYAYFLLPAGVLVGLLEAAAPVGRRLAVPRAATVGLAGATVALLAWVVVEYVEVEANTRTLQWELARIGTGRIVSQPPDLVLLTQWRDYLRFARIVPHEGMSPDEIAWMARVTERYPYSPSMLHLAEAQALNGQAPAAQRTLARLCMLHSPPRCRAALNDWHELANDGHPQLAAVPLPSRP